MPAAPAEPQYLTAHTPPPLSALLATLQRAPDHVPDKYPPGSLFPDEAADKPPTGLLCDSVHRNSTLPRQIRLPHSRAEVPPVFQLIHERTTPADTSTACCSMPLAARFLQQRRFAPP